tara:strand:- start:158 stop:913 length:756 start_codon:yes stop_codon:yes gene_type:complete
MDWLLIEYVEDYVELSDEQEELVGQKIAKLSEWHRREEIPHYINHLDELMALDLASFTLDDLKSQEAKLQEHTQRIVARVAPELFELAQKLSDKQVDELMNNIRIRHTKYKKKYQKLNVDQTREVYAERISDSVDKWFGSVTKEQQQLIKLWAQELHVTSSDWVNHQTQMRIEINALLFNRLNPSYFKPHFDTLLFEPTSYYSSELEKKIEHNRSVANQYLVQIVNRATPKQARHYREELQDWKDVALDIQ